MKLKIGQKVVIDKKVLQKLIDDNLILKMPEWVTSDIYTIENIDNDKVAHLNKNLPNSSFNKINLHYLKTISKERKDKLHKINKLKK